MRSDIWRKKIKYYVVRDKALPEVLQKVVEVKRLLETDKNMTVQEAAEQVGLSRSSFYKYKDDILPFFRQHERKDSDTCDPDDGRAGASV